MSGQFQPGLSERKKFNIKLQLRLKNLKKFSAVVP